MKRVGAVAAVILLLSGLCSACVDTVTTFILACGSGDGTCSNAVYTVVPGEMSPYGVTPVMGTQTCCGWAAPTIVSLGPQCLTAKNTAPRQRAYVQAVKLLVPDCRGKYQLLENMRGPIKLQNFSAAEQSGQRNGI